MAENLNQFYCMFEKLDHTQEREKLMEELNARMPGYVNRELQEAELSAEARLLFEVSDGVQEHSCCLHANIEAALENVGDEGKRPEPAHSTTVT
ncbi:unnamed protein product [Boreogadus saida]